MFSFVFESPSQPPKANQYCEQGCSFVNLKCCLFSVLAVQSVCWQIIIGQIFADGDELPHNNFYRMMLCIAQTMLLLGCLRASPCLLHAGSVTKQLCRQTFSSIG